MTTLLPLLIAIATVVAVAGLALAAVAWHGQRSRNQISRRLALIGNDDMNSLTLDEEDDWRHQLIEQGEKMERWFGDTKGESTQRLLAQAGWRSLTARGLFYLAQIAAPFVLAAALAAAAALWQPEKDLYILLGGVAGFCMGGLLARRILRTQASNRLARLRGEIPVLVNLLVLLFEAGLGVRQSLNTLVREASQVLDVLSEELYLVMRQVESGADLNETLNACTRTLGVDELQSVMGVLLQVNRYGGEIREPLLEALKLIEERRSLTLREQVNALSGRMTVVMVAFFFPALLICVAGPAFVSIMQALGSH